MRAKKFTSTSSTKRVEDAAETYLSPPGAENGTAKEEESGTALVIYGRSGAGKTYLLSKIMARCLDAPAAGGCVVIRFLGTTPRSSNVRALLTSLCGQLRRAYGKEAEVPSEFQDLRAYFAAAVKEWPSAEQPLTLFIDSVDQLDDSNGGRRLEWLPVTGLPPHVKLVVSTLPDYPEFRCLSILESKLEKEVDSLVVAFRRSKTDGKVSEAPKSAALSRPSLSRGARDDAPPRGHLKQRERPEAWPTDWGRRLGSGPWGPSRSTGARSGSAQPLRRASGAD